MIAFSRTRHPFSSLGWLLIFAGCAVQPEAPVVSLDSPNATAQTSSIAGTKAAPTEALPGDRLRACQEDKRRLETALRDVQKRYEDLQKRHDDLQRKLDALMAIDREMRNRPKNY